MPVTLELMGTAIGMALIVGVIFGIISAVKQYSWVDFSITTLAFFGQSMPVFWFALMVQLAFSVVGFTGFGYHIALPSAGSSSSDTFDLGDRIEHLILPACVLSLLYLAIFSRFMRSSMLEVIHSDYVRTASAKGLTRFNVIMRHAFRNALIPLVTIIALTVPDLVGGAVVTEHIFAWPGMGSLFINALGQFDFAVLMAVMCLSRPVRGACEFAGGRLLRVARSAREVLADAGVSSPTSGRPFTSTTMPSRFRAIRCGGGSDAIASR